MKQTIDELKALEERTKTDPYFFIRPQPFNYWWWRYKVLVWRIRFADWILPE